MSTPTNLRLALAQVNPTVGAVAENAALIADWIARARDEGAELVLFPELSIPGYPAEDLYLKRHFLEANAAALSDLAAAAAGIDVLVGFAEPRIASAGVHPFDAPAPRVAHNAPPCCGTAGSSTSTASSVCRTTPSSTSSATSSPATSPP